MYRGGLFDHITAADLPVFDRQPMACPHFEKMLYDNALLLLTYAEAYAGTEKPALSIHANADRRLRFNRTHKRRRCIFSVSQDTRQR